MERPKKSEKEKKEAGGQRGGKLALAKAGKTAQKAAAAVTAKTGNSKQDIKAWIRPRHGRR